MKKSYDYSHSHASEWTMEERASLDTVARPATARGLVRSPAFAFCTQLFLLIIANSSLLYFVELELRTEEVDAKTIL